MTLINGLLPVPYLCLSLVLGGEATAYFAENFPDKFAHLKGVTEETPPGVHRLYDLVREGQLTCPAINVSDRFASLRFMSFFSCFVTSKEGRELIFD